MSLNIAPVYGKQYIRYAETWEAATDKPNPEDPSAAPLVGTVELLEFAVVTYATYAGPNKVCAPGDFFQEVEVLPIVGVNQSYIPTALSQPYTARQASIATSGSLIVEVSPESEGEFELNTPLRVAADGRADADGAPVSLNGTTPIIREVVEIGGRRILIVSFT
jgi:hypothetical protein